MLGDFTASGNISSSTLSGIGNVTAYSASVQSYINSVSSSISGTITTLSQSFDARLDYLEGPFSTSVDARLDALEAFTGSQGLVTTASFQSYTASVNADLTSIHQTTASLNTFSASAKIQLSNLELNSASVNISIANLNTTTASLNVSISNINSFTQSFSQSVATRFSYTPTTGSNTFVGVESISGSLNITGSMGIVGNMVYTGSVRGNVTPLNIVSTTASMDLSLGNFFTITLNNAGAVRIEPTNIQPGETITLRLTQPSGGYSSVNFPSNVDYPTGYQYNATPAANAVDVVTFVTFDNSSLYYSRANQFV
jgi:hypothetical protein